MATPLIECNTQQILYRILWPECAKSGKIQGRKTVQYSDVTSDDSMSQREVYGFLERSKQWNSSAPATTKFIFSALSRKCDANSFGGGIHRSDTGPFTTERINNNQCQIATQQIETGNSIETS